MGGKALKHTYTRRYERAEFEEIKKEIYPKLNKYFSQVAVPLYYRNKESFSDIDFVVGIQEDFKFNIKEVIQELFHPNEIFHNNDCYSFNYKELQVDLITVNSINFESNLIYLSYNGLGSLIGRLSKKFGLKYGKDGLWYEHEFKGLKIASFPVSKDYQKIFSFLGLDFNKWRLGFDELEDIFKFVAESSYFDWRIFQLKELNSMDRKRNLKRSFYMAFIDWVDKNAKHREYSFKTPDSYLPNIIKAFPEADLIMKIRKSEYEYCKKLYVNSKFNGNIISKKFNLIGNELGKAIINFKKYIAENGYDFNDWIINNEMDEIYSKFENSLKKNFN